MRSPPVPQPSVNLRRVVELRPHPNGTGTPVLDDGEEVPVSRRKRVELRRTLRAWRQ